MRDIYFLRCGKCSTIFTITRRPCPTTRFYSKQVARCPSCGELGDFEVINKRREMDLGFFLALGALLVGILALYNGWSEFLRYYSKGEIVFQPEILEGFLLSLLGFQYLKV